MTRRLTDLQLERFNAEVLSLDERAQVERVLEASADDAEALRLMRAEGDAYLLSHPPAAFAAKVAPPPRTSWVGWLSGVGVVVAAVATVLVLLPVDEPATSVKGDAAWTVTAVSSSGARVVSRGAEIHPAEALNFRVTLPEPRFVSVVSHAPDGWFVYVPRVELGAGDHALSTAALLDDTVGNEELFLLSSTKPFEPEEVRKQLEVGETPEPRFERVPLQKSALPR